MNYVQYVIVTWILIDLVVAMILSEVGKFDSFCEKHFVMSAMLFFPVMLVMLMFYSIYYAFMKGITGIRNNMKNTICLLLILVFGLGLFTYNRSYSLDDTNNIQDKKITQKAEKIKKGIPIKALGTNIKTKTIWLKPTDGSHLKYYEDYRMITDRTSKQWKFQQRNDVQEDYRGFLMQDGEWYAVALGSYFGKVGTKYIFTMSTGKTIKTVKGDYKANRDTCKDNYLSYNGHILEFMINTDSSWMIENGIIRMNFQHYRPFKGKIIKIERVLN